tara:strand:- start:1187 stop:1687 length:501 start_codon:yes stop_codon:yes gene_type:complete
LRYNINFDKKLKINISFFILTSFLLLFSCASSKPELTENHPEIEKLWIDYFDDLNNNKFDEAVSYLDESVLFSFNSTGVDIEGYDKLKFQLKKWKESLDEKKLYLKLHDIESIKLRKKMTMIDVKQGEYDIKTNKLIREIRRYYHFYNFDDNGWRLYMIADAKIGN